jgi:translation initiation factor 1
VSGNSRLVYSTDRGRIGSTKAATPSKPAGDGIVRIRRETSGRSGKGVTTIAGVPLAEAELRALAKQLKQQCATGGSVKEGVIEIQGDHRTAIKTTLEGLGYRVKLAGG